MWIWQETRAASVVTTSSMSSVFASTQVNGQTRSSTLGTGTSGTTTVISETISSFVSQTQSQGVTLYEGGFQAEVDAQGATTILNEAGATAIANTIIAHLGRTLAVNGAFTITAATTNGTSSTSVSTLSINSVAGSVQTVALLSFGTTNGTSTHSSVFFSTTQAYSNPYVSTTAATTETMNASVSETSTRQSNFPTSTSSTRTATTTGTATSTTVSYMTSTTASSEDTFTTSVSSVVVSTVTTYLTANVPLGAITFDTVVQADATDWLWSVSAGGTGPVTAIGASFTRTTFSASATGGSVQAATFDLAATATVDFTYLQTTYTSATIGSSATTSSVSTYLVGVVPTISVTTTGGTTTSSTVGEGVPLTVFSTASISYTTTAATTYTFSISSATVVDNGPVLTAANWSSSSAGMDVVITTYSGGTSLTSITYTFPVSNFNTFESGTSSVTITGTTHRTTAGDSTTVTKGTASESTFEGVTVASATMGMIYIQNLVTSGGDLTFTDVTIGQGWQATPTDFGRQQPMGTNIGGIGAVATQAFGWPQASVAVLPVGDTAVTITLAGLVPTSLKNTVETTALGGFGWDSTETTTVANTPGVQRQTLCDSFSNTTTSQVTWNSTNLTLTLGPGDGIAVEAIPIAESTTAPDTSSNPFLQFPAFPNA